GGAGGRAGFGGGAGGGGGKGGGGGGPAGARRLGDGGEVHRERPTASGQPAHVDLPVHRARGFIPKTDVAQLDVGRRRRRLVVLERRVERDRRRGRGRCDSRDRGPTGVEDGAHG